MCRSSVLILKCLSLIILKFSKCICYLFLPLSVSFSRFISPFLTITLSLSLTQYKNVNYSKRAYVILSYQGQEREHGKFATVIFTTKTTLFCCNNKRMLFKFDLFLIRYNIIEKIHKMISFI